MRKLRVAVLTGNNYSLYSIKIIYQLFNSKKVELLAVFLEKTLSKKNIQKLFNKIKKTGIKKLKASSTSLSNRYLEEYIDNTCKTKNVKDLIRTCQDNIKVFEVNDINNKKTCELIRAAKIDILIYTGGGILKQNLIDSPKIGIINGHSGELPFFRGMNVAEWMILYDKKPKITINFIDKGIDTGRILLIRDLNINGINDVCDLREKAAFECSESIIKVVNNLDKYIKNSIIQKKFQGKQFFIMHPKLMNIVEKKLRQKNE